MTLDELTDPLTVAEAKAAIYAALEAQGLSTTSWKPGAVVRTLIAGLAIVIASMSQLQAAIAKMGLLDTAEGDWLKILALGVYGVTKDEGTFASGTVTLANNGGGVYAGGAGDLVVQNPTTKKTYRSTGAWALGAGPGTFADVAVEAVEKGSTSTSTPGTITALVTVLAGVTVTNAAALVGTDAETDPTLRAKCREKMGSLSPNGPKDAYAYLAKTALRTDGQSAGITRVKTTADGSGGVTVVVANATGPVSGTTPDPASNLGAANKAIQEKAAPLGITATVSSATAKNISVTYQLWLLNTAGLTNAQIEALAATALTNYLAAMPVGGEVIPPAAGKVYRNGLLAAIMSVRPVAEIVKAEITVPAADVDITSVEAPVLSGAPVATITQVSV